MAWMSNEERPVDGARDLAEGRPPGRPPKRILLVDDDADILESLAALLEDTYDVSVAQNGAVALHMVEAQRYDAVILDLMMPILDGVGFVRAVQQRGIHVPIILSSAGRDLEARVRELKVEDCVAKPFGIAELEEKLERVTGAPSVSPASQRAERHAAR